MISWYDIKFFIIGVVVFFSVAIVSKYVSLASLSLMTSILVVMIVFGQLDMLEGFLPEDKVQIYILTIIFVGLSFFLHRENIKRLLNHTENKFSVHKEDK